MIIMAKWNLETPSLVICPFRAIYKYSNKYLKKYYKSILDLNDIEQSIVESISNVKKKFIKPTVSYKVSETNSSFHVKEPTTGKV